MPFPWISKSYAYERHTILNQILINITTAKVKTRITEYTQAIELPYRKVKPKDVQVFQNM
jgi:hypothetical protein